MSHEVRVRVSVGLIALAVFHVALLGSFVLRHPSLPHKPDAPAWTPPQTQPRAALCDGVSAIEQNR